jgi:hypothetical protein
MGQLVLLVVAAAWAAVLLPPLLRSRIENRPNSSVSDFRDQLSSLQRAMPPRGVAMRSMARPLTQSPLSRPAASGRPAGRSSVRPHNGTPVRLNQPVARRQPVRTYDATPRGRSHTGRPTRPAASRDELRRRRANVLFVLALTSGCTIFLAATTQAPAMVWVSVLAIVVLFGYVCLLGRLRQRDLERAAWAAAEARPPDATREEPAPAPVRQARPAERRYAVRTAPVQRRPLTRRPAADRWSHAV